MVESDEVKVLWASKKLEKWIDRLGIKLKIEYFQKTLILGTARILRKTLKN